MIRLITFILLFSNSGCTTTANQQEHTSLSWNRVGDQIVTQKKSWDTFKKPGPFSYEMVENYQIAINPHNTLKTDLFLPRLKDISPLVIMVHGNKFNKGVHRQQAQRLASWGFHTLVTEVPNQGQWVKNGFSINKLVNLIYQSPQLISKDFDKENILLVGHSFGGSAVTIASGDNPHVAGIILLDPAVVHDKVQDYMNKVNVPVILLGADPKVFLSRKRKLFFKNIKGPMAEITISGSTHNDAQLPSITKLQWGLDLSTTNQHQETFLQGIISGAFSITKSESLKYVWQSSRSYFKKGILKSPKLRANIDK